jgi:hypothetical protein
MNTTMREGFVHQDEEADVYVAVPPAKPKVVYQAPKGPHVEESVDDPTNRNPGGSSPEPDAKQDKDRNAPPPIDLDAPAEDIEWPIKLKLLYKPTRDTKNRIIHELLIRAPTAGDISLCGNPVRLNTQGDVIVDEQKMTLMLARLSDVFPPMIEQLDARDWISCSFFMQRILLPNRRTWEPTPS